MILAKQSCGSASVQCFFGEEPTRVALIGEIDFAARPCLEQVFEMVTGSEPEDLVVDLSSTTFFSCTGLAFLVRLQRFLQENGREVTLRGSESVSARVIRAAGLSSFLSVEEPISPASPRPTGRLGPVRGIRGGG